MSEIQHLSPYQGLYSYEEKNAPFFFGRSKDTRLIIANLFATPLTLLYGPSGVGKTSVLHAGVVHQLHFRNGLLVVIFSEWQSDPLGRLKNAVADAIAALGGERVSLSDAIPLAEYLAECAVKLDRRIMIILDQFDEYFLYYPYGDAFSTEFPRAVTQREHPISFLISIREDSLAKLDRFEGLIPTLFDNYLRLERLDRSSATEAIIRPLEVYNQKKLSDHHIKIENDLIEAIIEQVGTGRVFVGQTGRGQVASRVTAKRQLHRGDVRVEAPYLQLVLERLWNEDIVAGKAYVMRLDTLKSLGGAERIVQTHLDKELRLLNRSQQEISARIFHFLVTPSGTKIAHTAEDLARYAEIDLKSVEFVLGCLTAQKLRILRPITFDGDEEEENRYEIFHDVLGPAVLDWRSRYFRRSKRVQLITTIALLSILISSLFISVALSGAIEIKPDSFPPFSPSRLILTLSRSLTLVVLNIMLIMQISRWLSRDIPITSGISSMTVINGFDVGILLGLLWTAFWYTSTTWPRLLYSSNPLGQINSAQFFLYLIIVPATIFLGFISFLAMRSTGQLTNWLFERFDMGFYISYFCICILIAILIVLNLHGYIPHIIRIPSR